jgi:hypothetical protein
MTGEQRSTDPGRTAQAGRDVLNGLLALLVPCAVVAIAVPTVAGAFRNQWRDLVLIPPLIVALPVMLVMSKRGVARAVLLFALLGVIIATCVFAVAQLASGTPGALSLLLIFMCFACVLHWFRIHRGFLYGWVDFCWGMVLLVFAVLPSFSQDQVIQSDTIFKLMGGLWVAVRGLGEVDKAMRQSAARRHWERFFGQLAESRKETSSGAPTAPRTP